MDDKYRSLLQQYRAEPDQELLKQLRNLYYQLHPDQVLWAQTPRGHLYHAWHYTFTANRWFTARALCKDIGATSTYRLKWILARFANNAILGQNIERCDRCQKRVGRGTPALTIAEACQQDQDD